MRLYLVQHGLAKDVDEDVNRPLSAQDREDVMLVGHLPHLQRLAALLICQDANRAAVHFRNGGVLCLKKNCLEKNRLQKNNTDWSILWHINPTLFYGED